MPKHNHSKQNKRDLYADLMLKARERGIEYPELSSYEDGEVVISDQLTGHRCEIKLVRVNETESVSRPV